MRKVVRSPIQAKIASKDFETGIVYQDDCRRMPHSPLRAGPMDSDLRGGPYLTPKIMNRDFNLECDTS